MAKKKGKQHKYAGRNVGPSRNAYWRENRLRKHKVRNLMKYNGMSEVQAKRLWDRVRHTRYRGASVGG